MLAARFCFSSLHISGEQPKSARAADLQAAFRRVQFDVAQNAAVRVGDFRDAADAAQRLILAAVNTHAAAPQAAEKLTRIVPITQGFDVLAVFRCRNVHRYRICVDKAEMLGGFAESKSCFG